MSRTDETNSTSRPILAIARGAALIATSAACMAPAITVNVVHQMSHNRDTAIMAIPYATGSAVSVLLAGVSPLAIRRAWESKNWVMLGVMSAVFACCMQFNLVSAVAVSSTARSERTGAVTKATTAVASLQKVLESLTAERETFKGRVSGTTAGVLKGEQAALRNDMKWEATRECTDATKQASRDYCAEYAMKTAAIEAALRVEAIDKDIRETRGKLEAANASPDAAVGQPADPQTATIATALQTIGVHASFEKITSVLNLELALILEVIGSFGPLVLAYVSGLDKARTTVRPDKKPVSGEAPEATKTARVSGAVRRSVRKTPDKAPDKLSGQANPSENTGKNLVRKIPDKAPKQLRLVALSGGSGQAPDNGSGQPDSRTDFDEKVRVMSEAGQTVRTITEQLGTTKWRVEEARKRLGITTKSSISK